MTANPLPDKPTDADRYDAAARFVRDHRRRGHLRLVASDGESVELPDRLAEVVDDAAGALAAGEDVSVVRKEALVTTSQAAEILGVSRPTLVRLLDQGEISYAQPGTHRRLRLSDVLAYREERQQRRAALDDMIRVSAEAGLYDIPEEEYIQSAQEIREERRRARERHT